MADVPTLRRIFREYSTIAVVGLSPKQHRPSHYTARYMQARGYRIIPVNPRISEVLGEKSVPRLRDIPERVDIVNCFRRSEEILPIAEEAIAIGARVLWLQLGIVNRQAAQMASEAGLIVVMNRCIMVEHARLQLPTGGEDEPA